MSGCDVSLRGDLIADTVNEDAADSNKVTQGLGACKDVNRVAQQCSSSLVCACLRVNIRYSFKTAVSSSIQ